MHKNAYFCINIAYLYIITKKYRHRIIKEVLETMEINSQDMFLGILKEKGFVLTQATLSRDIKELKIIKIPTSTGGYTYQFSEKVNEDDIPPVSPFGFVNIQFSGPLAVMKTRPGYAMAIASEIDKKASDHILGTVAGDDTILLIPKEDKSREEVLISLSAFIPNIL
ncbi:MAG: ArgR family transcriptional regulator [Prevotella sp.]|jgi:transcriptional regulator of arginine metabolism|nr:ArgR family transcriptional regulator [Prevotella sp.]